MKSVFLMGTSASAVVHIKSTFRLVNNSKFSSENFPLTCDGWMDKSAVFTQLIHVD